MSHLDEQVVADWTAGRLDDEAREHWLAHVDGCDDCRQLLAEAVRGTVAPEAAFPRPVADGRLHAGDTLGVRYELLERLGAGAMGAVWRARDEVAGHDVALKVLPPERAADAGYLARFRDELHLARSVTHPNVCRIHDLVEADGRWFLTMELIEGVPLSALTTAPLPPARVESILRQIASGLAAAHAAGVVHRDLKPLNVLVDGDDRVVVLDFGIARREGADGRTQEGHLVGTPRYMAPEQAKTSQVDARADVYAFGLIGCELLTGQVPLDRGDAVATLVARGRDAAPSVSSLVKGAPPRLAAILDACLQRDPEARPADGAALVALFYGSADPPVRRKRWPVLVSAAVIAMAWFALQTPAPAPTLAVGTFESPDGWLGAAMPGLLREELADGWGVGVGVGEWSLGGRVEGQPGALRASLHLGGRTAEIEAVSLRSLARQAAAWAVEQGVAVGPTDEQLAATACASPEAWRLHRRARRAAAMRAYGPMLEQARAATEADPTCPLPWLLVSAGVDGTEEALQAAERAVELSADASRRHRLEASTWLAYQREEYGRIAADAAQLALLGRNDALLQMELGQFLLDAGETDAGLAMLEAAGRSGPDRSIPLRTLAAWELGLQTGWLHRAPAAERGLRHAEQAVAAAPHDLGARALRALGHALAGDAAAARADAEQVLAWRSSSAAILALVTVAAAEERWDEAAASARRLFDGGEAEAWARALLSGVDLARGAVDRATEQTRAAAEGLMAAGDPEGAREVWADLAWNQALLGDLDDAVASAAEARALIGEGEQDAYVEWIERSFAVLRAREAGAVVEPLLPWVQERLADESSPWDDGWIAHAELYAAWIDRDWPQVRAFHRRIELSDEVETWASWPAAEAAAMAGDDAAVERHCRRLIEDPYSWEEPILRARARLVLADLYVDQGRTDEARALLQAFVDAWDRAPDDSLLLGEARRRLAEL